MNETIIPQVQLNVNTDEEIIVRKKKKSAIPFRMVGTGTMESINLIEEMLTLSKPAQQLLNEIIKRMTYNYEEERINYDVYYKASNNAERQMIVKGFKELRSRNLVRRVKRSHYVVNPYAVITNDIGHFKLWNSLEEKKEKSLA